MTDACQTIKMSPDNQFIIATGTYKPRVKCFEVNNLSVKFERCFDSEVVCFSIMIIYLHFIIIIIIYRISSNKPHI